MSEFRYTDNFPRMRFEVLTAMTIQVEVFWVLTPCSAVVTTQKTLTWRVLSIFRGLFNDTLSTFLSTGFYSPYGPWPSLMDFSIHRHLVGLLGWGISPTRGLYRHTGQHNTETRRHTSMPRAGFEPAILMFKRS
jgi:hypothetical protein